MSYMYVEIWREETLPNFAEVMLLSAVPPEQGKIYVMYHGTDLNAAKNIIQFGFKRSQQYGNMLGAGVYVSRNIEKAAAYPLGSKLDQVILKLRVNVGKVIRIDKQNHALQKTWHEAGYDTAWVPPHCGMVKSGLEEDCVWDPNRIKVVGIEKAPYEHKASLTELVKKYKKS